MTYFWYHKILSNPFFLAFGVFSNKDERYYILVWIIFTRCILMRIRQHCVWLVSFVEYLHRTRKVVTMFTLLCPIHAIQHQEGWPLHILGQALNIKWTPSFWYVSISKWYMYKLFGHYIFNWAKILWRQWWLNLLCLKIGGRIALSSYLSSVNKT